MPPAPVHGAEAVVFDDAAADTLAWRLDELAEALRSMVRATADGAESARQDWAGFTRTWFDRQLRQGLASLGGSRTNVAAVATEVRQAKTSAALLQSHRNSHAARQRQLDVERHAAAVHAQRSGD